MDDIIPVIISNAVIALVGIVLIAIRKVVLKLGNKAEAAYDAKTSSLQRWVVRQAVNAAVKWARKQEFLLTGEAKFRAVFDRIAAVYPWFPATELESMIEAEYQDIKDEIKDVLDYTPDIEPSI